MFHGSIHIAAAPAPSPARLRCVARTLCLIATLAPVLGGCAMSFPMASLMPGADDVTGSNSPVPFGRLLDEEDRRREKAAMATALDPQGDGGTVKWENAKSGNKGSVAADGKAYSTASKVCRGFVSELKLAERTRSLQGTACVVSAGEWAVSDPGSTAKR